MSLVSQMPVQLILGNEFLLARCACPCALRHRARWSVRCGMSSGGGHISRYLDFRSLSDQSRIVWGTSAFRFVPRGDPVTVSASGPVPVNLGSSGGVSAVRFDPLVRIRSNSLARFAAPPGGV